MKRLVHAALALASFLGTAETRAAAAPDARGQAELLAQAGEARYRLALLRSRKADPGLERALRALEEACDLDPANLRALAYLGLARLESAARGGRPLDREALDPVRGPLEQLFKLSRGWADPPTRALLGEVARSVDASLAGMDDAPADVLAWWQSWRGQVTKAAASAPSASNVVTLVEDLRTSPLAWVRERAAEKLSERTGKLQPGVVEALGLALREDKSPWVRAAAAKALSTLMPPGWDVRLAEALRNDGSVFVRRTCAEELAQATRAGRPVRAALVEALGNDTPRVASASASSLGALGGSREALVQALASESGLVRSAAAMASVRFSLEAAHSKSIPALLSHERAEVRAAAAFALGTGPDHLPGPVLRQVVVLLDDKEAKVRAFAAGALFNRPMPDDSRLRLRSLLDDENPHVRLSAAEVLCQSGDEAARRVLEELRSSDVPTMMRLDRSEAMTIGGVARDIIEHAAKEKGKRP